MQWIATQPVSDASLSVPRDLNRGRSSPLGATPAENGVLDVAIGLASRPVRRTIQAVARTPAGLPSPPMKSGRILSGQWNRRAAGQGCRDEDHGLGHHMVPCDFRMTPDPSGTPRCAGCRS